jgi:hypothetical protein
MIAPHRVQKRRRRSYCECVNPAQHYSAVARVSDIELKFDIKRHERAIIAHSSLNDGYRA